MYDEQIEGLISAALADGVLTEKEKQILFKKAQSMGIDLDEFEMVLDARLVELQKAEKEKAAKSAPKSDKYGTVRKCPACGAIVPAFQGVCPECGHEFMDVDANASSKKLAEQLLKENNTNKQKRIIETFPLPNTKADLLEFLTALKPRISDVKDPLSKSYFKKYQECIEKAKVTFPNDKLIAPFIADFINVKKEANSLSKKTTRWWNGLDGVSKYLYTWALGAFAFVLLCVIGGVWWWLVETAPSRYEEKVIQTAYTGDLDKAIVLYTNGTKKYHNKYHWGEDAINAIFEEYLKINIKEAENIYNSYELSYHASGDLQKAYLKAGLIDDYWRFSRTTYNDANDYSRRYDAMEEVVRYYCENGEIMTAKTFIEKNVNWFYTNVDKDPKINDDGFFSGHADRKPYKKAKVQEKLMTTINQY